MKKIIPYHENEKERKKERKKEKDTGIISSSDFLGLFHGSRHDTDTTEPNAPRLIYFAR